MTIAYWVGKLAALMIYLTLMAFGMIGFHQADVPHKSLGYFLLASIFGIASGSVFLNFSDRRCACEDCEEEAAAQTQTEQADVEEDNRTG